MKRSEKKSKQKTSGDIHQFNKSRARSRINTQLKKCGPCGATAFDLVTPDGIVLLSVPEGEVNAQGMAGCKPRLACVFQPCLLAHAFEKGLQQFDQHLNT